ncbi:MAG: NifU family protein [Bacteroidetes bacterium]|nr:NifU family protein [Bacteroidota bacterium]
MKTQAEVSLLNKVNLAIDQLRPFLHADGGDMELVEITPDFIVKVRLKGACKECAMSAMTLKAGLEDAIKIAAPEVLAVQSIDDGGV